MTDERSVDGGAEASDELRVAFWSLVVLVDVAMLAAAVGVVLIALEGELVLGAGSLAVGVLGFVETYRRIRTRRNA